MMNNFYIYRYVRLDTNVPFYIGKGVRGRAYNITERNTYFKNIIKISAYKVEIMLNNLTELQAFAKEIEFIKLYKRLGFCKANLTDGGEGCSGFTHSIESRLKFSASKKGKKHSAETKSKISASSKGRITSEETKAKMSEVRKGKIRSPETRAKQSAAVSGNKSYIFGKKLSAETRAKMSVARRKRTHSEETRAKIALSNTGKKRSEDTKAKISASRKRKK